jgi:hypothetical protein
MKVKAFLRASVLRMRSRLKYAAMRRELRGRIADTHQKEDEALVLLSQMMQFKMDTESKMALIQSEVEAIRKKALNIMKFAADLVSDESILEKTSKEIRQNMQAELLKFSRETRAFHSKVYGSGKQDGNGRTLN